MDILEKFKMSDFKPIATPIDVGIKLSKFDDSKSINATLYPQLVGSLVYITNTRPNIAYAVNLVSRFMTEPKNKHWKDSKRIFRYIKVTINFGILYNIVDDCRLIGYIDLDWVGDVDDRKPTFGYIFKIGSRPIPWYIKKQPIVSLSKSRVQGSNYSFM